MLATTALLSLLLFSPGQEHGQQTATVATGTSLQVEQHGTSTRMLVQVLGEDGSVPSSGRVTVLDGERVLATLPVRGGRAELTTNLLQEGRHLITADFAAVGRLSGSRSARCAVGTATVPVTGNLTVTIPAGHLTITSATERVSLEPDPGTVARRRSGAAREGGASSGPARVLVTDTRAGDLGFTVQVRVTTGQETRPWRTSRRGVTSRLCQVAAVQLPGNGLAPGDLRLPPSCIDADRSVTVAIYPSGAGVGTADLRGTVVVAGSRARTARLTWTVL